MTTSDANLPAIAGSLILLGHKVQLEVPIEQVLSAGPYLDQAERVNEVSGWTS